MSHRLQAAPLAGTSTPPLFFRVRDKLPAAALAIFLAASTNAASLPDGYAEARFASGIARAVAMEFAPDGRLFVCEQAGRLRVIENGVLLPDPFVTLDVDGSGERGLLGVTFDPGFPTNRYLYVYYTTGSPPVHNRVSRFTADGNSAVPGSETVILDLDNLSGAENHNGGAIHFGSDDKLYIAAGENGNPANAQTLTNLLGKILRLNPDGSIPTDNPFYGTETGRNRAIWALGFRNPFTFAVQPGTGRIFVNDVGEGSWEEIDELIGGANYGWPNCEGACHPANSEFRDPIFFYSHGSGTRAGNSIAGGAFYNPPTNQFPNADVGAYFFADFINGWIRKLSPNNGNQVTDFASGLSNPVDLKVGPDGRLYYLARGNGTVMAIYSTSLFVDRAGAYNGLFYETSGGVRHGASGFFSLTLRPNGSFTARLQQGTKKSAFSGVLDLTGHSTNSVKRPGTNNVIVELYLDPNGPAQIIGRVTDDSWEATLVADRAAFDAKTNPATNYVNSYTLLIPGSANSPSEPAGDGAGNFTIDMRGNVKFTGALADASPIAQKVALSTNGAWPLYASLYGGRGSLLGWVTVTNSAQPDLGGLVSWSRPAGSRPKVHTNGFAFDSMLIGSFYFPPGTNTVFEPTSAIVGFTDGNLTEGFTNNATLLPNGKVTIGGTNKTTLVLTPKTGRFTGGVTPPGVKKRVSFKGAVLQKQGYGGGFFLGTNTSGRVYFGP
jgi:glucose/arabinose dehydrogenase